jgi:hypothetical protein
MISENFVYFAFALSMVGTLSYLVAMLRGKAKPNRVTFLMWALAPLIGFFGQLSEGVGVQSLFTLSVAVGPLAVVALSFFVKQSYWKLGKIDYAFGVLAAIGIILWQVTDNGLYAIVFSILADFLAAIPTLIKSYYHPETENATAFGLSSVASVVTLLTLDNWRFEDYAFSLYILFIGIVFYSLIQFKIGNLISPRKAK